MKTKSSKKSFSPDADLKEVLKNLHKGGVKDPKILRRIQRRSTKVQEEILKKHGILDVAADLIHQARNE